MLNILLNISDENGESEIGRFGPPCPSCPPLILHGGRGVPSTAQTLTVPLSK